MINFVKKLLRHSYDQYVPYRYLGSSILGILGIDGIKVYRYFRVMYWTRRARKYPPFAPFYLDDKLAQLPTETPKLLRDYYTSGSSIVSDVLPEESIERLRIWVQTLNLEDTEVGFVQLEFPEQLQDIRQQLIETLFPMYKAIFPAPHERGEHDKIYVGLRIDFSVDGEDKSPITANWHSDRFIPTLNAIYFPFGADWGAFEKDVGSAKITPADISYFIADRNRVSGGINISRRDDMYWQLGRDVVKYRCESNSMVVGSHHLQHRRSPISTPGRRVAIFIDHYNFFFG